MTRKRKTCNKKEKKTPEVLFFFLVTNEGPTAVGKG